MSIVPLPPLPACFFESCCIVPHGSRLCGVALSKSRDAPSHPFPFIRQTYIVARSFPEAGRAEVSVTGEREANMPSAGETISQLQHFVCGARQRPFPRARFRVHVS
jgi:hypothetical protein